jgi:GAF domain-containing protein/CheY-like chemotaxis protein
MHDLETLKTIDNPLEKYSCQLTLLQEANQLIASQVAVEQLLTTILRRLLDVLDYRAAQIYLASTGASLWLYLEVGQGAKPVTQNVDIFTFDEHNIVSDAARYAKSIYIPNTYQGPYSYHGQSADERPLGSELATPLKSRQRVLGVLRVQAGQVDAFDEEDIDFLANLASLLAATISNNQTIQQLQDSIQEVRTLYSLQHKDTKQATKREQPLGYQYDRHEVTPIDHLPSINSPSAEGQTGITASLKDEPTDLIAPIQLYGETIGLLEVEDPVEEGKRWTADDINFLEEISSQVALAIENARLIQQTQERTKELSTLFEATRQLTETIDPKQIYNILIGQVINYLKADKCSILLLDRDAAYFEVAQAKIRQRNEREAQLVETRVETIEDFPSLQRMLKQPQVIIQQLDAADLEPSSRSYMERDIRNKVLTLARFPVVVRNKLVAIIEVEHFNQRRDYTENELQLAQAIISQVTVAIENAQLFQQTQAALSDTEKFYDISRALVESTSIEDIFSIVLENVKAYDIDRVSISLLDRSKSGEIESVTIVATWDRDPGKMSAVGTRFSTDNFALVQTFAKPPFHPLISHDLRQPEGQDERMDEAFRKFVFETLQAVTLFSAPMFLGTEYKGVLSIYTRKPHLYSEQEIRIYQTLADQAIIAIENQRLLEATRKERDRASLLYELGQALSRTTTVEQVKEVLMNFTPKVGATHSEIYITDGGEFLSVSSTIPARRNLPVREMAEIAFTKGPEALALSQMSKVVQTRHEKNEQVWPLKDLTGMPEMQTFACIPFESQRSTLFGILTFFQVEAEGFTEEHIAMFDSIAIQTAASLENVWLLEQTNLVLKETELLYRATRSFNSAQRVEDLLSVMIKSFADIDIDFMSIALISGPNTGGQSNRLNTVASWQRQTGEIIASGPSLTVDEYSFIQQLRYDSHLEVDYLALDPATQTNIDRHLDGVRSLLFVPLSVGRNWLGVLVVASKISGFTFKMNMVNQISNLAGQAAVVIKNLQLVEETQQNLYYSEILSNLGQKLLTADSSEAIYDLAISAMAETEPDRGIAIFRYNQLEAGVELEMVATWDNPRQEWPVVPVGARFSTEDLGLVPLLKTGLTLVSTNAGDDERFSTTLKQLLMMMQLNVLVAVPLWLDMDVGGFILIGNQTDNLFLPETIRLYEDIGRETSVALENRRLFEEAQYRARQLQTAAEISQAATANLDLDTLLSESVNLIKERFNFYHASIFLIDEYQRYAVIKAATGEIGQKMLARRHKLRVEGKSVVGSALNLGKPRIALDVGKEAVQFRYSLLPNTRSEIALPLIAQGRVIGALDAHSDRQSAFSESDITILQSMANQFANAIEAARAFQESKKALEEVSKLHQHYVHEQWKSYIQEQHIVTNYSLLNESIGAEQEAKLFAQPVINRLITEKQPLLVPDGQSFAPGSDSGSNGRAKDRTNKGDHDHPQTQPDAEAISRLIAPLTLNGQAVIGTVDFEIPDRDVNRVYDEDVLRIIEAVTNQAAQAIEAARLFEQTQISREEAEALYEVGRSLVTIESEQDMFNTVLGKMLSTLGLSQGGILLFEEGKDFGRLYALFEEGKPVAEPNLRIPIKDNLSYQRLIETKQPVPIEDVTTDPLVAVVRDLNIPRGIVSLLLVPIIIDDEVIGAMGADSVGQKHIFTEREMNLAMAMADQLSISLQNRRLIEETKRRAILLQTSSDVGRVATSILDEGQMMDHVVDLIKERFGFSHVQIFLMDEAGQFAILHKSTGEAGRQLLARHHKLAVGSQSVIGQVTDQRKPLVARIDSADQNGSRYRNEFLPETQAELAVPLQVGDILIGALDVHSTLPNAFTDEEISTLETLAAQLAVAIQNARAFREQQETAERLKEMDKLKTQFLANMSHELRTPLNSIIGFSRVILKGIDGPLTELQKTDLTSIHNSGQHLLGLINNILDLSKIEAGKMELNFEETEVEPIVKTVMATAVALVKDKPVILHQDIPENLPKMWADPTRIRQIILNLVSNACKFTDKGSVTAQVRTEPDKIIFSVADTGIGIPANQIASIFEEFTQVDSSTTRKVGGTGLGLPISRHFVEMHRGKMWVESKPGQGSVFNFYIPLKPPAEGEPKSPDEPVPSSKINQNGKQVIIAIDDDPSVITLYQRYLEKQNYEVIGINNTRNIIAQIKEYDPYAILLDIIIPEKDGWSVIKELKEDPFTKDIPVIICSIVSDKNRGFSLGAADYLIKPIVENELVEALKRIDNQDKAEIKVLVVDDQADDVLLIRRFLEAQPNYTIFEAGNGVRGLELVKTKEPDLIILDLNMPEMDGFTMIEMLKANEKTRLIPIIIVSAKELTSEEQQRLTGHVEVLLHKGIFTENELLEDVSQALKRLRHEQKAVI